MPFISPENGYLTVINWFRTDTPDNRDRLVHEMRKVVDSADFPGWVSSTVHRGQDKLGTLNFIQWRAREDLEARYSGDAFKHRDMPVFLEIITDAKLLQTEVELAHRHPSLGGVTEISPDRDDYTVVEILGMDPENQGDMIANLEAAQEFLVDTPGYRSQSVLRGARARGAAGDTDGNLKALGTDNSFVVIYSQWASKGAYDAYRLLPEDDQPAARRKNTAQRDRLTTSIIWNTYSVAHSRSAAKPAGVA